MDELLRQFREEAERIGVGAGRKFPARLKALGGQYARERREAGGTWLQIAKELGVVEPTVQRWAKVAPAAPAGFHEVRVEAPASRGYAAVLPGGLRIEGLELEAIVALARALS